MTFPFYFEFSGMRIHPHAVLEVLGYALGTRLYFYLQKRWRGPVAPLESNMWLMAACVIGALAGAKILAWLESPVEFWNHRFDASVWIGGKTVVGGLLGGWAAIEFAKKKLRIDYSTGDLFVFPLILGMSLGRVGCFLTGLEDHTHGVASSLPWAVDFGDGIPRHPTQLYEIVFLLALGFILFLFRRKNPPQGFLFRVFICTYLLFRFFIEFIKPRYSWPGGLSAIQMASLLGCVYAGRLALQLYARPRSPPVEA